MITIQFNLENQLLKRTDKETIVNNSKNIIQAQFAITGEIWDNLVDRFVIFKDAWHEETIVHLSNTPEAICTVPSSCLNGAFFKVSVYGGDLITTNEVTIPLIDSGYNKHHSIHHKCNKPTKDVFVQIFEKLHIKIDNIICDENNLLLFSDGVLVDSITLPGVDEAHVRSIVAELIQDYIRKDELDDILKDKGYVNQVYMDGDEIIFE